MSRHMLKFYQDHFLPRNFQFTICYILLLYSVQSKLLTAVLIKWSQVLCKTPKVTGFQASTAVCMRFSLFFDVTQSVLVIIYRRFGTSKGQAVWDCLTFNMGPIGYSKTSVNNYQSTYVTSKESEYLKRIVAQLVKKFVPFYGAEFILNNKQINKLHTLFPQDTF
jgi:hypothetical protein